MQKVAFITKVFTWKEVIEKQLGWVGATQRKPPIEEGAIRFAPLRSWALKSLFPTSLLQEFSYIYVYLCLGMYSWMVWVFFNICAHLYVYTHIEASWKNAGIDTYSNMVTEPQLLL